MQEQYERYEKRITDALEKYKKNKDKETYKKINHQLDMYELFLDENFADKEKYDWHINKKKLLNQLKQQKQLIGPKQSPSKGQQNLPQDDKVGLNQNIGQQYTNQLRQEVRIALQGAGKGLDKAIEISNFIKIELDRQISQLDDVYEQNKDFEVRMKKVKQGLIVILRAALANKLTRCFAVLLLLAIIGVIVVSILRNQGTLG